MTLLEALEAELEAWKTLDYARRNFRVSVINKFAAEKPVEAADRLRTAYFQYQSEMDNLMKARSAEEQK